MADPWQSLVDVSTLHRRWREAPDDLVILDVRHSLTDAEAGPRAYALGHLPGAIHAHVDRDLSGPVGPTTGRHPLPDAATFVRTSSSWGIGDGVQVVAYDDVGGAWAGRVWWLLRDYGHDAVAVLDGGIQAWQAAGLPIPPTRPVVTPRVFRGQSGHLPRVSADDLLRGRVDRLLDVRAPERYRGDVEPIDAVAGHIPGARSVPYAGNLAPDGRFLPPEDLRRRYLAALDGVPPERTAVYCGSGVTSAHDLLAMELAGLKGAALYPGSWSEWIRDPTRAVERGDPSK